MVVQKRIRLNPSVIELIHLGVVPDNPDIDTVELFQIWQLFTYHSQLNWRSLADVARPLSLSELRTEDLELEGVEGKLWTFWDTLFRLQYAHGSRCQSLRYLPLFLVSSPLSPTVAFFKAFLHFTSMHGESHRQLPLSQGRPRQVLGDLKTRMMLGGVFRYKSYVPTLRSIFTLGEVDSSAVSTPDASPLVDNSRRHSCNMPAELLCVSSTAKYHLRPSSCSQRCILHNSMYYAQKAHGVLPSRLIATSLEPLFLPLDLIIGTNIPLMFLRYSICSTLVPLAFPAVTQSFFASGSPFSPHARYTFTPEIV